MGCYISGLNAGTGIAVYIDMKKVILGSLILIALSFAIPQKAAAQWQYSVTQVEQIDTWMGQPVYATVTTVYSVDAFNQPHVVSRTVVGPPN